MDREDLKRIISGISIVALAAGVNIAGAKTVSGTQIALSGRGGSTGAGSAENPANSG